MNNKKNITHKDQIELILAAIADLESYFEKIKKSNKFLQFKGDGEAIFNMFFNIISAFTLNQLKEVAVKSKMINKDGTKTLDKTERFDYVFQSYMQILNNLSDQMKKHISELK